MLQNFYNSTFMALLESFHHARNINRYKIGLKIKSAHYNINQEIWIFINDGYDTIVVRDTEL